MPTTPVTAAAEALRLAARAQALHLAVEAIEARVVTGPQDVDVQTAMAMVVFDLRMERAATLDALADVCVQLDCPDIATALRHGAVDAR